ncbi:hypothetical protein BV22DRAFT_1101178 [Leucogyrophana mollusca]|uniref:Uncharacterized protein n=1 Tax=Leucogyrophana mollusca TaxID=85980 RepID=A0ACB8C047_9AGAM|nr:hypothetical protein BV22DRAFT_1101178 [Leucogyrophana mollusca]
MAILTLLCSFLPLFLQVQSVFGSTSVQISSIPSADKNVVDASFLGISFELSYLGLYFGNDTSSMAQPMANYLSALGARVNDTIRLRIGGNSMDDCTYVPSQNSPLLQFTNPQANVNDQPVSFGLELFDVLNQMAEVVNAKYLLGTACATYLAGLSLRDPNSTNVPLLAGAAQQTLGRAVDAFLLGNEPDLYTSHGQRPNLANYTVQDYIADYSEASNLLKNTSGGDIVSLSEFGGPSICCQWDLATLLQQGYLSSFEGILKYITMQHYPQNNCGGEDSGKYKLDYYLTHANAVSLAAWQNHGVSIVNALPSPRPEVVMSEFNTASCGGIPGLSDTFGAALWIVDYALQLATAGYTAAYLHTREPGISYNIVQPPYTANGTWDTGAPYYALLTVAEALRSPGNGSYVQDLNIDDSVTNTSATSAGYAVFDAESSALHTLVIFNFANDSSIESFDLPANITGGGKNTTVTVKYLAAPNVNEKTTITWGGETLAGVGNGILIPSSGAPNVQLDCAQGCTVNVTGPSAAVVFVGWVDTVTNDTVNVNSTGNGGSDGGNGGQDSNGSIRTTSGVLTAVTGLLLVCLWL